jgi:hypothetical protein
MQSACTSCKGKGKTFKQKQEREVLELHVQKGSPDGHRVVFRGKADEEPDVETGDVVFVLREQKHEVFKRKGADLFIERSISLVEALCGFEMEVTHLDGRKLLIKSAPGEVVRPMSHRFDPFAADDDHMEWEMFQDADCPDAETVAQAEISDAQTLKKACETQLKAQGVDVTAFVIDESGKRTYFKTGTREHILATKHHQPRCTMYIRADPDAQKELRMMKAVKNEGMPTFKNPFIRGNLFLILNIEFPKSLSPDARQSLCGLLPPPLNAPALKPEDEDVETHTLTDIDPVQSLNANQNMMAGGEAYDEDDQNDQQPNPQCAQM